MVTRDEVAREAGTSSAVVSYVINNGPRNVSEATRARVLAAIDKLGYRPNAVARSLRSSSSSIIGVIATDVSNAYCGELALQLENSALAHGHTLLLGNSVHDDDRQAKHVETFLAQQARGIVFIGSTFGDEQFRAATSRILRSARVPLVFLDRTRTEFGGVTILVDNRGGAREATEHLLNHGHRLVANFSGVPGHSAIQERSAGWSDALSAAGIEVTAQRQVETPLDRYEAFKAARTLLSGHDRPRAIFSHSDEQSIGIVHAATDLGLRIPQDLALVSFDGIKESEILPPGLTTARQPVAQMAELAVKMILGEGQEGLDEQHQEVLPVDLVVRHSCGDH
ncbi:LacI family DNA-binding transcriptional regulator [Nocardioides sp. 616]|uniref:LacI family DNA-binding transcriptional regulator n=1 Tax=Nocardioides sp. 616 TaxID=2268090 RepID=UPI000CE55F1F|nr:LacI family DNA-binding transcriptional regulator [Nocardioides sp. 616]